MKRTAKLAMLDLSPEEEVRLAGDFDAMVRWAGELSGAPPLEPSGEARAVPLRADVPGDSLPAEDVLGNAKAVSAGRIAVPPVL